MPTDTEYLPITKANVEHMAVIEMLNEETIASLRAQLDASNRLVAESGRIVAELQENIAKEREAKLHETQRAQAAMQEARNYKNRWIEASRQQEIAESDARALAKYASISAIVADVDYGAKKLERVTALIAKYEKVG